MILDNAHILTMDEALPRISALAIAGGVVLGGVDSREDAIASHMHEHVDLSGFTVIPGLVDAHVHMRMWALRHTYISLESASSPEQIADALRAAHAGATPGDWLIARGWREAALPDRDARAQFLDEAAGTRPCACISYDGHSLWINRAALTHLNLTWDDVRVPGGIVETDDRREPTGILREASAWHVRAMLPNMEPTTAQLAAAAREAARMGITCIHDLDGAAGLRAWRAMDRERGLPLRVVQHLLAEDLPHAAALGIDTGFGSQRLHLGGIKVFVDGTLGAGTAWVHDTTQPSGYSGTVITDASALEQLSRDAAAAGFPLVIHAIGDAACAAAVDALDATRDAWASLRAMPRIEHAQLMRHVDIVRCAQLGIALSIQPTHMVSDRDMAEAAWGDRLDDAYAWRSMIDAGCMVLLGSDAPIEPLNPLAALHVATARDGGAHGLAPARGPWMLSQVLDADAALRACTSWAADASGMSSSVGRLSPGRAADLVVLSGDPTTTPWSDIEVVATMVEGRWTYGAANLAQVHR